MASVSDQRPGPSAQRRAGAAAADISLAASTEAIMAGHRRIRRLSRAVDDAARRGDPAWVLAATWQPLADVLDDHTRAEAETCHLLTSGSGLPRTATAAEAAACHEDIQVAISAASIQPPGSARWWDAVRAAQTAIGRHLDRCEPRV